MSIEWGSEEMAEAMASGLRQYVRGQIRLMLEDAIKEELDKAVETACNTFELAIKPYLQREGSGLQHVLRIIVEYRKKENHSVTKCDPGNLTTPLPPHTF